MVIFTHCPECDGHVITIEERGETTCQECGLVLNEREVDLSHNGVRTFTKYDKDKKERMGSPISILTPDIGLSTVISRSKITNPDLRRAAKWDTRLSWEKKNMLIAITELKRIGGNLNFPEHVKKLAVRLYKDVFKKNILRGRSIKGMVVACVYYACKEAKLPITLREILDETVITETHVKKCYTTLCRELSLKSSGVDPISLIPGYCTKLNLDVTIEKEAIKVLEAFIKKTSIFGKDPKGLCAGAIYLVSKLKNRKISQKETSRVIGVSEVTVRLRYKELLNYISFAFHDTKLDLI